MREFTFGHARQLESVLREHLVALCERVDLLPGAPTRAFVDIDSLLRPVYGHAKQGASYGHTKIAGKQVLRKGLSPLVTTISTDAAAPVIAGMRLRAGQDQLRQGRGAHGRPGDRHRPRRRGRPGRSWCAATRPTATARWCAACRAPRCAVLAGADPQHRGRRARSPRSPRTPGPRCHYPGAVRDPDTGAWISDAEVAEIAYTAFASTPDRITARLIVRRVKDARYPDALFPVWRYHPFFTNTEPAADGRHHPPPPRDHRNRLRRPDRRTPGPHAFGTLRRQLGLDPVRGDRPQPAARRRRPSPATSTPAHAERPCAAASSTSPPAWPAPNADPILHLPTHWPWSKAWLTLWHNTIGYSPPLPATA